MAIKPLSMTPDALRARARRAAFKEAVLIAKAIDEPVLAAALADPSVQNAGRRRRRRKAAENARVSKVAHKAGKPRSKAHTLVSQLVAWRGSMTNVGYAAGVTPVAVSRWKINGKIGRVSAYVLSQLPGCPLSFADMRPDLGEFEQYNMRGRSVKNIKALVRDRAAYVRAEDKINARKAKD